MLRRTAAALACTLALSAGSLASAQTPASQPAATEWGDAMTEAQAVIVGTIGNAPTITAQRGMPSGVARRTFVRFHMAVESVLTNPGKLDLEGKEINIVSYALTPMQTASRYIVVLNRGVRGQFFTVNHPNAVVEFSDAKAKELKDALNPDNWPWGKPSQGLQAAAFVKRPTSNNPLPASCIMVTFAVRNVSPATIWMNVYSGDSLFNAKTLWDGTPAAAQGPEPIPDAAFDPAVFTLEVKPGETIFITPGGRNPEGMPITVDPIGNQGELTMKYNSTRDAQAANGQKLWQGTLETSPVKFTLPETPARPQ